MQVKQLNSLRFEAIGSKSNKTQEQNARPHAYAQNDSLPGYKEFAYLSINSSQKGLMKSVQKAVSFGNTIDDAAKKEEMGEKFSEELWKLYKLVENNSTRTSIDKSKAQLLELVKHPDFDPTELISRPFSRGVLPERLIEIVSVNASKELGEDLGLKDVADVISTRYGKIYDNVFTQKFEEEMFKELPDAKKVVEIVENPRFNPNRRRSTGWISITPLADILRSGENVDMSEAIEKICLRKDLKPNLCSIFSDTMHSYHTMILPNIKNSPPEYIKRILEHRDDISLPVLSRLAHDCDTKWQHTSYRYASENELKRLEELRNIVKPHVLKSIKDIIANAPEGTLSTDDISYIVHLRSFEDHYRDPLNEKGDKIGHLLADAKIIDNPPMPVKERFFSLISGRCNGEASIEEIFEHLTKINGSSQPWYYDTDGADKTVLDRAILKENSRLCELLLKAKAQFNKEMLAKLKSFDIANHPMQSVAKMVKNLSL